MIIKGGYAGKILYVDLTSGSVKVEPLDPLMAAQYLGGQGINIRLAYDLLKPGIDPLSPENPIIIGAGALCGTPTPSSGKVTATTKFPVNGAIGTAAGCGFGPQLKWAGYDNVVITGASDKPVYLYISNKTVELRDAAKLWGKDIVEATDALREKYSQDVSVIGIGPAGENLVKISLALIDKMSTLGRGGLAAVMGSKKMKAIVVQGDAGIRLADGKKFKELYDTVVKNALADKSREFLVNYGLMAIADTWVDAGMMLVDNKRKSLMGDEAKASYGTKPFIKSIKTTPWAPPSCITCDKSLLTVREGEFEGLESLQSVASEGIISFSFPFSMSVNRGVKCADIYNRYGLDLLDGPYLIELMIELYENGLVSKDELGMEPKADYETIIEATEKIVNREGIWGTVADGIPAILEKIPGADKYAVHAKGYMPFADGRINFGVESMGLLTHPRGGNSYALVRTPSTAIPNVSAEIMQSLAAKHYKIPEEAQARIFKDDTWDVAQFLPYVENNNTACNCTGLCFRFFIGRLYDAETSAAFFEAVTGIPMTGEEYLRAGERTWNLQKMLNVREGFDRKDDKFPKRWLKEPLQQMDKEKWIQDYSSKERIDEVSAEAILDRYYQERGWDIDRGVPSKQKLEELDLSFAIEALD
jgi:aldehyde:ferredoxin oxidoreductase